MLPPTAPLASTSLTEALAQGVRDTPRESLWPHAQLVPATITGILTIKRLIALLIHVLGHLALDLVQPEHGSMQVAHESARVPLEAIYLDVGRRKLIAQILNFLFNVRTSFCVSWSALVAAVGVWHGSLGLRELLPVLPDVESPTETVGHGHGNALTEALAQGVRDTPRESLWPHAQLVPATITGILTIKRLIALLIHVLGHLALDLVQPEHGSTQVAHEPAAVLLEAIYFDVSRRKLIAQILDFLVQCEDFLLRQLVCSGCCSGRMARVARTA
eukprot:CAMPEP_0172784260 /NCGR_PEP_ID=MMETSP1074-20121228/204854_1 /TAXON_ID=2916 /ORGANISM="Ceratium fusus, Strain PA161109" /LENGTH=273 /DNA_ID=CAMNT_0013621263 /DNA_START=437 /DNA_END=1257 /DNA_ORIENTATION=-